MTDKEINFQTMAEAVRKLLREARPQWEPLYKKMGLDFGALDTALDGLDAKAQARGGQGSTGYTEAKDLAEIQALDAAMPVVKGLKALVSDGTHPALATLAAHTRSSLDDLRGLLQVAALEELHTQARAVATELADEMVTTKQLDTLRDATAVYKPMLGTPRQQTTAGTLLRDDAVRYLGGARAALGKLDVRVPNLESALPELVAAYRKAREIVDAGHGGKADALEGK
ncbi:MAG: hypothetical protein JWR44_2724 [Hymenobacter sp.]|jgi:hypothetical protein|nr:hypothetical protein [Hymenobacter sp.]